MSFCSNTYPALLKASSFQEQNQPCFLNTLYPCSCPPFPCPVAYSLGGKQPFFQFVPALSLSITVSITWDCLLCLGGYWSLMLKEAIRYSPIHKSTRLKNTLKYWYYSQLTMSDLLHSLLIIVAPCIVYIDTHIWDSPHPRSLHTEWNPGY